MLSKDKRLNLKKDFSWVASGKKVGNNFLKLFLKSGDNTQVRIGIALSKAAFKKATERNRARRLTSKGFENLYSKLSPGINIVAMPREGILKLNSDEITGMLEDLLKRNGVIKR